MRFYRVEWQDLYDFSLNRLKIGSYCVFCRRSSTSCRDLCDGCESQLQRITHSDRAGRVTSLCLACGIEGRSEICASCAQRRSPFTRIVAPYRYAFPLDKIIHQLKYHDRRVYARVLGSLLCAAVPAEGVLPDVLVSVPLSRARARKRGFNQAADIARWCASELGVPHWPDAAERIAETGSLAGLSRAERQQHILGAFRAADRVCGKRIAIVDDVLTTGATAREFATELYDTGALSVELWVLARTSSTR